jgi:hypothetical protein
MHRLCSTLGQVLIHGKLLLWSFVLQLGILTSDTCDSSPELANTGFNNNGASYAACVWSQTFQSNFNVIKSFEFTLYYDFYNGDFMGIVC